MCGVSCARLFAYVACGMTLAGETVARESSTDAAMHQMDVNDSALFMDSNNGEIFTREDAKAIEDALKCAICECVWNGGEDKHRENITVLGKELYDAISEVRGYKKEGGEEDASRDEKTEVETGKEDADDAWNNGDDGWSVDDDPLLVNLPSSSQAPRIQLPMTFDYFWTILFETRRYSLLPANSSSLRESYARTPQHLEERERKA